MLSQNQILFGNKMLQEVAISWDVPILKAARILAGKEINDFWKWINADEFLNYQLNETQNLFEKEKKQYAEDCKNHEKPWELWQAALVIPGNLNWVDLYREPNWSEHCIYRRKQIEFVPEYFSGLNWRDAEHLIGKTVECTNNPDSGWHVGMLTSISKNEVIAHFGVLSDRNFDFVVYIRTCEETFTHPTINISGVELPMPETVEPSLGTKFWLSPACNEIVWGGSYHLKALKAGRVHLTKDNAKAWADWWKTNVIDKMI